MHALRAKLSYKRTGYDIYSDYLKQIYNFELYAITAFKSPEFSFL